MPSTPPSKGLTYRDSGVDIAAATDALSRVRSAIVATHDDNCVGGFGGFGGLFRMPAGMRRPLLCASTDGVGTKLQVAVMAGRHGTVGRDLVNHCTNDILVQGARPLFLLDYVASGRIDSEIVATVIQGFADGCAENGCALLGGETAEMPGTYREGEYDLAATIVGVVEEDDLLPRRDVAAGDVLIGLRSSGLHTNGFSLARTALFERGGLSVHDTPAELGGRSVADALLAVHRTYAPLLLPLLPSRRIKAMCHITGGGYPDNLPRILPEGVGARVDTSAWTPLPIFQLIRDRGDVAFEECYRALNMGVGIVLVTAPADVDALLADLVEAGEQGAVVIGELTPGDRTVTLGR